MTGDEKQTVLAPCVPVDTSQMPDIGVPLPGPFADDTQGPCERCGQQVWIGPKKLAASQEGAAMIVCYHPCLFLLLAGKGKVPMVNLDPHRREIPR